MCKVWIRSQHMLVSSMNMVATYVCVNSFWSVWCCNKWVTNGIATGRAHSLFRTMPRALIYSHLLLWLHLPAHNFGLLQLTLMYMMWRTLKVEAPRHSGDHNAAVQTFMPLSECSSILFTLHQTIIPYQECVTNNMPTFSFNITMLLSRWTHISA